MPAISKIRLTNVVYEGGKKRYNDEIFLFDGHNGAILLENGGGKTVFIQTVLQAVHPHSDLAGRKVRETLSLTGTPAHLAVEWILSDFPRRYALTAVTLFLSNNELDSYRYVYEYGEGDANSIEQIPFVKAGANGKLRPAGKDEVHEYYQRMSTQHMNAHLFPTLKSYHAYLESEFKIIPSEWKKIATINSSEGDVEKFFEACNTTNQLVDRLLIPTVEEGMAGAGAVQFAETFEKQRDHFKASKQLRRQIHENQMVENRVRNYLQVFQEFDEAEQELLRDKELAKALHTLSVWESEQKTAELEIVQREKEQAVRDLTMVQRKKASREIVVGEQSVKKMEVEYHAIARKLDERSTALQQTEHQQLTLEYAKHTKRKRDEEAKKAFHVQRLRELDQDEDTVLLLEEKERNTRQIKGVYEDEERKLQQQVTVLKGQIERQEIARKQLQTNVETLTKQTVELGKLEAVSENTSSQLKEVMERVAKRILNNPLQETVEEMLPIWRQQSEGSIKNQRLYDDHIGRLKKEIEFDQQQLKVKRSDLSNAKDTLSVCRNRLEQMERTQERVKDKLLAYFPKWSYLESLYAKQSSIEQSLFERSALLESEKEKLLRQERMVTRLSDEYQEHDFFVADPELSGHVIRWKDQFDDLEFGTKVLQEACHATGSQAGQMYERYAYWANTLVTTEQETGKLTTLLEKVSSSLRNPVIILSHAEVRQIVEGKSLPEFSRRQVFPTIWRDNLIPTIFQEWKSSLLRTANETLNNRRQKEEELQHLRVLVEQVEHFFAEYPQEQYLEAKSDLLTSEESVGRLEMEINERATRIQHMNEEWRSYQAKRSEEENRQQTLGYKIREALEYQANKTRWEQAVQESNQHREKLQKAEADLQLVKREQQSIDDLMIQLQDSLSDVKDALNRLQGEELYREVRETSPLPSRESLDLLRMKRRDLNERLNSIQKGRSELEDALERCDENIKRCDAELKTIQKKAEGPLDAPVEFPLGGEEEIFRLIQKVRDLKEEVEVIRNQAASMNGQVESAKARLDEKIKRFYWDFPEQEIDQFDFDLELVKEQLRETEARTEQKINLIQQAESRLQQEVQELQRVVELLEKKHEKHEFLRVHIREVELSEEDRLAYPYRRYAFAETKMAALEQKLKIVEQHKVRLDNEKTKFKGFCGTSLHDVRLRERTISGIENKHLYQEVKEWAANMSDGIARGIRLLEEDLRGHDEQLQHFITQIQTHLQKVAQELRTIPTRTRVKVEDRSKEIFSFTIPEWSEQEGKQKLRSQVDWMIAQLETDQFKDGEGKEDIGKMKKWIFDRLQSKSLFHVVMGDQVIRVKCRKVSNDGQVSGSLTTWEESNNWSGGEKWSKNMTLFLGILNYLAEKKQAIVPHHKRHRTVIMDNPFGKASSEHVLDPVFFIADQLGFQLISLTAHAEGKFIRDYFPIVYSCRLRDSVRGDVSIVTKEKEMKHAYFRDHDPQAMWRLTQHEQLSLFDKMSL